MTIQKLYKELGKLIAQGHGRKKVCVEKSTFNHALENDGDMILDVDGLEFYAVPQADDDGGIKILANGAESLRSCCVLHGYDKERPNEL